MTSLFHFNLSHYFPSEEKPSFAKEIRFLFNCLLEPFFVQHILHLIPPFHYQMYKRPFSKFVFVVFKILAWVDSLNFSRPFSSFFNYLHESQRNLVLKMVQIN
jgi:hypothetical protein